MQRCDIYAELSKLALNFCEERWKKSMNALVLAGGYPQKYLIEILKSAGYEVLLVDWNEYPPARSACDIYFQVSTLDVAEVEKIARDNHVTLIITVCTDQALNTMALLSERLGLPCYISAQKALEVTNKLYMKKIFTLFEIPTANYYIISTKGKICQEINYPVVVKPVDCNSSKGVIRINSQEKLQEAISRAIDYSRTSTAIVEEYIAGEEYSVDAVVVNSKVDILAVSKIEKLRDDNTFIVCRSTLIPFEYLQISLGKIKDIISKIANAFELDNCPLLVQLIVKEDNVYVVEFSARTGGGEKYKSIKWFTGIDIVKETVNMSLHKPVVINKLERKQFMLNEFIYCHPGKIAEFEGFEDAVKMGVCEHFEIYKSKGYKIDKVGSSGDRAASICIIASSYEELKTKYSKTMELIKIISDEGIDIVIH